MYKKIIDFLLKNSSFVLVKDSLGLWNDLCGSWSFHRCAHLVLDLVEIVHSLVYCVWLLGLTAFEIHAMKVIRVDFIVVLVSF